jgi:hypothetical protein
VLAVSRILLWLIFVWLAFESVVTAAASIYWAAERDLSAALISVLMSMICAVLAREFWRGLGRPAPVRR